MELNATGSQTWFDLKSAQTKEAYLSLPDERALLPIVRQPGGRVVGPEAPTTQEEKLRKAAEDFEAVFLFQMLKQIRNTVHKEEFLNGGNAEDMFTGMLDEELAKVMAGSRSTGLSEMIYQQMRRMHGVDGTEGPTPEMPAATPQASALRDQVRDLANAARSFDAAAVVPPGSGSGR